MSVRLFAAALAVAFGMVAPAVGETDPCAGVEIATRVIEIHYREVGDAAQLADQMIGDCGAYKVPRALHAIIIEDEPARLEQIARAIAEWDEPPREVEVSVSLLIATRDLPPVTGVADELRDISRTLSEMTRWTRFRSLGTANLRLREGGEGQAEIAERYRVSLKIKRVDQGRRRILVEPFRLDRLPAPVTAGGSSIEPRPRRLWSGELDLEEGRQHLVGATSRGRQRAIFLVFTAWSVDDKAPAATEVLLQEER
ncbi:MAG: hypothetical protein Q9Q40_13280 [Acidobacteriota bacterium]|nr:hypothetical protein [Acidobacteriota bacterium]MDQ7088535.1 hypothetical protein [Acidobacteriota bacterium]